MRPWRSTAQYTDWPGYWGGLVSQHAERNQQLLRFRQPEQHRILVRRWGGDGHYSYKAFGEELAAGSGTTNSMRYMGQYGYFRDLAARLYVRARYYDLAAGRWDLAEIQ